MWFFRTSNWDFLRIFSPFVDTFSSWENSQDCVLSCLWDCSWFRAIGPKAEASRQLDGDWRPCFWKPRLYWEKLCWTGQWRKPQRRGVSSDEGRQLPDQVRAEYVLGWRVGWLPVVDIMWLLSSVSQGPRSRQRCWGMWGYWTQRNGLGENDKESLRPNSVQTQPTSKRARGWTESLSVGHSGLKNWEGFLECLGHLEPSGILFKSRRDDSFAVSQLKRHLDQILFNLEKPCHRIVLLGLKVCWWNEFSERGRALEGDAIACLQVLTSRKAKAVFWSGNDTGSTLSECWGRGQRTGAKVRPGCDPITSIEMTGSPKSVLFFCSFMEV